MARSLFLLLAALFWLGCATMHPDAHMETTYSPPNPTSIGNTITIERPFDEVWNSIVRRLAASRYQIDHLEKESRIITLGFATDDAETFVDCGLLRHRITFKDRVSLFDFAVASDDNFEMAYADRLIYWIEISPKADLATSINLYVSPIADRRTEVGVNVRFDLTKMQHAVQYTRRQDGEYRTDDELGHDFGTSRWSFTTHERSGELYKGGPYCVSKGIIEGSLLDFARPE
jgi:hypothetical protein